MGAGDVIAQTLIDKQKIEWNRVGRFAFIGATLVVRQLVHENLGQFVHFMIFRKGPSIRFWYLALERLLGAGVTVKTTLSKVALDQIGFAPLFQIPVLTYIGLLQGQKLSNIKAKLQQEWGDIVITGWKV